MLYNKESAAEALSKLIEAHNGAGHKDKLGNLVGDWLFRHSPQGTIEATLGRLALHNSWKIEIVRVSSPRETTVIFPS